MTPHSTVRLTPSAAARFPDLARRDGTVELEYGNHVAVRFANMAVHLPQEDVTGE